MSTSVRITRLFALVLFATCDHPTSDAGSQAVASVTITPDSVDLLLSSVRQMQAVARNSNGTVLSNQVSWQSSDITRATVSGSGLVRAVGRGKVTITATADTVEGTATVVVVAHATDLELQPSSATIREGDTLKFQALMYSDDGGAPTDSTLRWSSSNTAVAIVSPSGVARGQRGGAVTITATTQQQLQATAALTVKRLVASVVVSPADTAAFVLDLVSLVTVARALNGDTLALWKELCIPGCTTVYPVTLENGNDGVATFVGCCTLRGVAAGVDTVTAKVDSLSAHAVLRFSALSFSTVSVGNYRACGLIQNATVRCWGGGRPTKLSQPAEFSSVSLGEYTACGLTPGGATRCLMDTLVPIVAPPSTQIEVGSDFMCGRTAANEVWCQGVGTVGQLGNGADTNAVEAVTVTGGNAFTSVTTGARHACALTTDSLAYCWGNHDAAPLGNGDSTGHTSVPVAVTGGLKFTQLSAGGTHTCGLTALGSAYCWGRNDLGQLGTGNTALASTPASVTGGLQFVTISAGVRHTCAITAAREAYCWGQSGTLGSVTGHSPNPILVPGVLTFLSIDAGTGTNFGASSTCGRTTDGVYCWGLAISGVEGVPYSMTPVKVEGQH